MVESRNLRLLTAVLIGVMSQSATGLTAGLDGVWWRVASRCGTPLTQEAVVALPPRPELSLPLRARLRIALPEASLTLWPGLICSTPFEMGTFQRSERTLPECSHPADQPLPVSELEIERAEARISVRALNNLSGWGRLFTEMEYQRVEHVLVLRPTNLRPDEICDGTANWWTYWVLVPES